MVSPCQQHASELAHLREWIQCVPFGVPVVHGDLDRLRTGRAKIASNVRDEFWHPSNNVRASNVQTHLVRGDLTRQCELQRMTRDTTIRTFSICTMKMRRGCSLSNGDFERKMPVLRAVSAHKAITVRRSMTFPMRRARGSAIGNEYAPETATMVAIICSAGAS